MRIILASKSPRRREILEMLGVKFEVVVADTEEICDNENPGARVETLAMQKAVAVQEKLGTKDSGDKGEDLIIACDTLVYLDGEFFGKPESRDDARRMLSKLSGRTHEVWSGICLCGKGKTVVASEKTEVEFAKMSQNEIERYLDSEEPFDKAGAYAVQGRAARYVKGLSGDYFNVVGLPVNLLYRTLKEQFEVEI